MSDAPLPELVFSKHALERMQEMHVRKDECRSARAYPVTSYYSRRHGSQVFQGRRIAITTRPGHEDDPDAPGFEYVTTVLWVDQTVYELTNSKRQRWEAGRRSPYAR